MGQSYTLAITGASGSAFGVAVLRRLSANPAVERVALLLSPTGKRCLHDEAGLTPKDLAALPKVSLRDERDLGADISSGSFRQDGMVLIPCSAGALGRIAAGTSETLVSRAADVCLKERRPLVLCVREAPWSLIDLDNARTVAAAGGIIMPLSPPFYMAGAKDPAQVTAAELLGAYVDRVLALLGHAAPANWNTVK